MARTRQQDKDRGDFVKDGDFWGSGHDVHADFNPVPGNERLNSTYFGNREQGGSHMADRPKSADKITDFFGGEVFQKGHWGEDKVEPFAPGMQPQKKPKGFMDKLRGAFGKH